jgi:predicted transcriptional regulator
MKIDTQRLMKAYFKILADDSRIRMIGLLSREEHTVRPLAFILGLQEPTISHHLSKLRAVGFVTLRAEGNRRYYRLHQENFDQFKTAVADIENLAPLEPEDRDNAWIAALPIDDWDKKILRDYTFAGRLRQIPMKERKLLVILRWLVLDFAPDVTYTEAEVNEIITRYHDDYATLRRDLISYGFLRRERGGSKYWLTPEDEIPPAADS